MGFYYFFKKGENAIPILRSNVSKEQKKKKKKTNKQTCSPYVILFFEAENMLKEEMKKQKLQTYFVTTMSNAKRVFLINISRITVQFLSLPLL